MLQPLYTSCLEILRLNSCSILAMAMILCNVYKLRICGLPFWHNIGQYSKWGRMFFKHVNNVVLITELDVCLILDRLLDEVPMVGERVSIQARCIGSF